ncbi:MAG TPA: NAD(P)H-dependent oxidoreductase [Ilumatobacter sp.]|nr:NAD(P)H-dependent oxidoreductase [Ilumatobacter sp.]
MSIVAVVGNPRSGSRTATVATRVAERAAAAAGLPVGTPVDVIELADLAPELFDWSSAAVAEQVERLTSARLAVIASPTYKGTYTGLLKAFLDRFGRTDLNGVVAVPVLIGAGAAHALAVEVHLRPLLVEIGASLPTRGLFVLDTELDQLDATLDDWLTEATTPLTNALRP